MQESHKSQKTLRSILKDLLKRLKKSDRNQFFFSATGRPSSNPNHFDFAAIESRISEHKYPSLEEFRNDLHKVIEGYTSSHARTSAIHGAAVKLLKYGDRIITNAAALLDPQTDTPKRKSQAGRPPNSAKRQNIGQTPLSSSLSTPNAIPPVHAHPQPVVGASGMPTPVVYSGRGRPPLNAIMTTIEPLPDHFLTVLDTAVLWQKEQAQSRVMGRDPPGSKRGIGEVSYPGLGVLNFSEHRPGHNQPFIVRGKERLTRYVAQTQAAAPILAPLIAEKLAAADAVPRPSFMVPQHTLTAAFSSSSSSASASASSSSSSTTPTTATATTTPKGSGKGAKSKAGAAAVAVVAPPVPVPVAAAEEFKFDPKAWETLGPALAAQNRIISDDLRSKLHELFTTSSSSSLSPASQSEAGAQS